MQTITDSDEDGDSETIIRKAPLKNKNILYIFCDGTAKSSERDEKWIECLDAETDISVCEYCK